MEYREFGRTGWRVSEIAFGAWQLGGQWGSVDDSSSVATLLGAFEAGINFVDTAEMYGSGRSELVIGEALRQWGEDGVRVATKIQPSQWPRPSVDDAGMDDLYPAQRLREGVDLALRRLGVDRLDLLQLHCWVSSGLTQTRWHDTLSELQREGKVDRIGVSLRDYRPDEGVELVQRGMVDSIQVIFNLFEQEPLAALFPAVREAGTAVMARVVLDSGALSGSWRPETYDSWEPGSVAHQMFRGERFAETLERVARLQEVTGGAFASLAEAAVAFALHPREVSTAIVGMSTMRSVDRTVPYSGVPFPAELVDAVRAHEWRRNFYA